METLGTQYAEAMISSLNYTLGRTSSAIVDRREVKIKPRRLTEYSPLGAQTIEFTITDSSAYLLLNSLKLQFRLRNDNDKTTETIVGIESSAAKAIAGRIGLGKMKHLEIRDLWLQKRVMDGKVEVCKVPGDKDPADLMTKVLSTSDILARLGKMNLSAVLHKPILDEDCRDR